MDRRELLDDEQEALRLAMDGRLTSLWTAMPAIVQSVNFDNMTVEVQPTIQARVQSPDGSFSFVNLPVLVDVPIVFPSAGGFTITFPIAAGDEVLVIFSSRCIDAWWSSGVVSVQAELRLHDLSDGFAIPGPKSVPKVISNISTNSLQIRSDDGATFIDVKTSEVKIKAPSAEVEAANITLKGNVVVTGTLTIAGIPFATHKHATNTNPSGVPVP